MKKFKGIIFDLDGTLLNTINDITEALNYSTTKSGFRKVSVSEAKYLVGNGAKVLIERTIKAVCPSDVLENLDIDNLQSTDLFKTMYEDYMYSYNLWKTNTTCPYEGVIKSLKILKKNGIKISVLSNKPERDTVDVVNRYFPGLFDIARGSRENVPLKPHPEAVINIINEMNLTDEEVIYCGDSDVDMLTSVNANLFGVGCTYGFRTKEELLKCGAKAIINQFKDILSFFDLDPSGVILVDKPYGMSSQDAITKVKKAVGSTKIGHAGTLDPLATGLLVVLLGDATKLSNYLLEDNKTYIGEITIGVTTDSLDKEGKVTETKKVEKDSISCLEIDSILKDLIGKINLRVPMHSAIKHNGMKLYDIARKEGKVTEELKESLAPVKENEIFDLHRISDLVYENDTLKFEFYAHVSKGTYIRSLCEEIGRRLNLPSYMTALRRVKAGSLNIEDAYSLNDIREGNYKIIDIIEAIRHHKVIEVNDFIYNRVYNGMMIRIYDVDAEEVFLTYKNQLIGIYEKVEGPSYKAKRVWKK